MKREEIKKKENRNRKKIKKIIIEKENNWKFEMTGLLLKEIDFNER
jgi:hypothetical protein